VTTVEKATAAKGRARITSGTQPVQARCDQVEQVRTNSQGLVHHGVGMPAVSAVSRFDVPGFVGEDDGLGAVAEGQMRKCSYLWRPQLAAPLRCVLKNAVMRRRASRVASSSYFVWEMRARNRSKRVTSAGSWSFMKP
jgi:hypothetical protein